MAENGRDMQVPLSARTGQCLLVVDLKKTVRMGASEGGEAGADTPGCACHAGLAHTPPHYPGGRAGTTGSEAQQLSTSQHLLIPVMSKKGQEVREVRGRASVKPRRH